MARIGARSPRRKRTNCAACIASCARRRFSTRKRFGSSSRACLWRRPFPIAEKSRGRAIRCFTDLFQRDGPVLDILDADYTFLNEDLAKHYGIPDSVFRRSRGEPALTETRNSKLETRNEQSLVASAATRQDDGWRRVDGVKRFSRGGILAQATTLAK